MRLSEAILATLSYSDYFSFPLTFDELYTRLTVKTSQVVLHRELNVLLKEKLIFYSGEYYYLPRRGRLLALRSSRFRSSTQLFQRAEALATRLGHFPGVLAIYLTGSLAMRNTDDGDIDFMIITRSGRLWLTRFLLTFYTSLFALRRTPNSTNNSGKLCLNLYLTPESYKLPANKLNLYTAYELIQAVPLYDPYNTRSHLLSANSWLKSYLPNYPLPSKSTVLPRIHNSLFIILLEKFVYHLQLAYMRPKITREYITRNSAFFHPHDPGVNVLKNLEFG